MTITEFLLARIAEDERIAHLFDDVEPTPVEVYSPESGWFERMPDPARVLAECTAKRAMVAMAADEWGYVTIGDWSSCSDSCPERIMNSVIRTLAAVYKDHSDYDETWKP